MGNKASKEKKAISGAGVFINLQKMHFYPGEVVQGDIHLAIQEPLPPVSLHLKFSGIEYTYWCILDGDSGTRVYTQTLHIAEFNTLVCDWPEGLEEVSLTIPFNFKLPEDLPGSFEYHGPTGQIKYTVVANLIDNELRECSQILPIVVKQVINPDEFRINVVEEVDALMTSVCCVSRGNCLIRGSIPKNTYFINETIQIHAEVDNSLSKIPIKFVEASLTMKLHVKAKRNKRMGVHSLTHTQGHGLEKGSPVTAFDLTLDLNNAGITDLRLGCRGSIVNSNYCVRIRGDVKVCCMCCGKLPVLNIPIILLPINNAQPPPVPPVPSNWDPKCD